MDRYLIPACLALLVAGTACSVKEDRGPCPCYLQVSFADPDAAGEAELLGWRDDRLFRERVRIEDARPAWTKPVPKGMLTVSDLAYASVTFRKQFATVFLDIRKSADIVRTCRFLVEGNSCGFDLLDFSPVGGPFRCEPRPRAEESIVTFRVPRQEDNGLAVTIQPEGSVPARFPLGEYIERLGYNWKTEELQDIYVAIDLARGLIDIRVADWEEGTTFPLIEQ